MRFYCFILVLMISCTNKFEREKSLIEYLTMSHGIDVTNETYVVIHQTNFCNSCTEEIVNYFDNELSKNTQKKWKVILTSPRQDLELRYLKHSNVELLIDNDFLLEKHGLAMSYDLFFIIKEGRATNWARVKDNNLEALDVFFVN